MLIGRRSLIPALATVMLVSVSISSATADPAANAVGVVSGSGLDNLDGLGDSNIIGGDLRCQYLPLSGFGLPEAHLPQGIDVHARDEAMAYGACERLSGDSNPYTLTIKLTFQFWSENSFIDAPPAEYPPGVCVANANLGTTAGRECTHQLLYDLEDEVLNTYHRLKFEFFTSLEGEPTLRTYSAPWSMCFWADGDCETLPDVLPEPSVQGSGKVVGQDGSVAFHCDATAAPGAIITVVAGCELRQNDQVVATASPSQYPGHFATAAGTAEVDPLISQGQGRLCWNVSAQFVTGETRTTTGCVIGSLTLVPCECPASEPQDPPE